MHYALCPACLTQLQITTEQLEFKNGLIRCSHCHGVFNANEHTLTNSAPEQITNRQTIQADDTQHDSIPSAAIWETPIKPIRHALPFGALSFFLCLLLLSQFAYYQSEFFTQNINLQPTLKRLNKAFDLHIPSYRNLDEIRIIDRQLSPHPVNNALLNLELTIKNTALTEQHYPSIDIVLTSSLGEAVAHGTFNKRDYLDNNETSDFFAPQELKYINLAFKKPRQSAAGFEISFH